MEDCTRPKDTRSLSVEGTAYEQGRQHGEQAKPWIVRNVEMIKKKIRLVPMGESHYLKLVDKNLTFLKKQEPELIEEMQGIADGVEAPFLDIALINLPIYFMVNWLSQECSSLLARGPATLDGKTYLVKNRDMVSQVEHVVLNRKYRDGRKITEVNMAGTVTYPGNGLNSCGLAVATSGVWSKKMHFDLNRIGSSHSLINSHLILEKCQSVEEAIRYLMVEKRMTGMNFILADRQIAVAVEVTPDHIYVDDTNPDLIVRTNHYLTPQISELNRLPQEYSSTYRRYSRATKYLSERYGSIRFQDMLALAADHKNGFQDSLCRHSLTTGESTTVYSSLIVLEDQQAFTVLGNPCEAISSFK